MTIFIPCDIPFLVICFHCLLES